MTGSQTAALDKFAALFPADTAGRILVHGGADEFPIPDVRAIPAQTVAPLLRLLETREGVPLEN